MNGLLVSHNIVVEQSKEALSRAEEGKLIHDMMSAMYVVRTLIPPTVFKLAKRIFSRLGRDVCSPSKLTLRDDESVMHGKDTAETSLLSVQSSRLSPARRVVMSLLMSSRVTALENGSLPQLVYLMVVRFSDDDTTVRKRNSGLSQEPHPS